MGQALQGRPEFAELWQALLAPVARARRGQRAGRREDGDRPPVFLPYGVPGFNFDQQPRGYNHTHHSQSDTFDKAVAGDLRQASAVMAVTALELANLPSCCRGGRSRGRRRYPTTPSAMSARIATCRTGTRALGMTPYVYVYPRSSTVQVVSNPPRVL